MFSFLKYLSVILTLFVHHTIFAQTGTFHVSLAPFSSPVNHEFSPVNYNNGIVYCSNLKNNSLITYQKELNNLYNIFYIAIKDSSGWENVRLLAKELTTNYNDGPATFNEAGNLVYYSRNNDISDLFRNRSNTKNKLGIYSAEFIDDKWTNIRPFSWNNQEYSFVSPALTPDASRLYFASDMPGGYGGADLYYCERVDTGWGRPVNLGPAINTPENESYPFAGIPGRLFFASDGHPGLGGKDIYYSQESDGEWIKPIHLDAGINSTCDDFGIVTDENLSYGYFSSNRNGTDDIFSFTASPVDFPVCDNMLQNTYCFIFYDDRQTLYDSIPVVYEWHFGNGIRKTGMEVYHCFPGPGEYEVVLCMTDSLISDSILGTTTYRFEIDEHCQVYINSPDAGIINTSIAFDGFQSNLPGYTINDYLWNFGEGFTRRGPEVHKVFAKKGVYNVQLGLTGKEEIPGSSTKTCVTKTIRIFDDYQELATKTAKEIGFYASLYSGGQQVKSYKKAPEINAESNETNRSDALAIKIWLLNNLTEARKELLTEELYKTADYLIEFTEKGIDPVFYPVLSTFSKVLLNDPDLKLEIAVHTNASPPHRNKLRLTEQWAGELCSFFLSERLTSDRVHCKAYGDSRPVVSEKHEKTQNLSGRIEFIFRNN